MKINFTARHFHASQSLQDNISKDVENLKKYFENIVSCHVVLDEGGKDKIAELVLHVSTKTITVKAAADYMHVAVSLVMEKAKHVLTKHKEKLKLFKHTSLMADNSAEQDEDENEEV